jgi:hypothetical protein
MKWVKAAFSSLPTADPRCFCTRNENRKCQFSAAQTSH